MTDFRETRLYRDTLGALDGEETYLAEKRGELRQTYLTTRENTGLLASEIPIALRGFTLHDLSHVDALWELATDIVGPAVTLTPTEGFIFGVAASIHDLGLAVAAYADGVQEVEELPRWRDATASVLRSRLGRPPKDDEIANAPDDVKRIATDLILRELHGEQAKRLGELSFEAENRQLWLIESELLRGAYGWLVGQIAASHNWSLSRVQDEFHSENAPAGYPGDWTVDARKVACLLRAADAAHLDARRAPRLLRAIRQPTGISEAHWNFQGKLNRPTVSAERVRFTSGSPFTRDEARSWWVCREMLRVVDDELRGIESLFLHLGEQRFEAKGVLAVEDPRRLAAYVRTDGWTPLDVSVRVADVGRLVERLGGARLYGNDETAPLRELIQNAQDAVRARRELERRSADWGRVNVALTTNEQGRWLEVKDTGVGMSEDVITNKLLDFGASLWESADLAWALPGLAATEFEPTGQFGIGFFSVLMLGDEIQVISRSYDEGSMDTRVLELPSGVDERPLLRAATPGERLVDPGSVVRVRFRELAPPAEPGPLRSVTQLGGLVKLCGQIAPALDVSLYAELGEEACVASAGDWRTISDDEFAARLIGRDPSVRRRASLQLVQDTSGRVFGRAGLEPQMRFGDTRGVLTVGGLAANRLRNIVGVFFGGNPNLARTTAVPLVDRETLVTWLTAQAENTHRDRFGAASEVAMAGIVSLHGGEPGPLGLAIAEGVALNFDELVDWARGRTEIAIVTSGDLLRWAEAHDVREEKLIHVDFAEEVLEFPSFAGDIFHPGWAEADRGRSLESRVIEAIALGWGIPADDLEDANDSVLVGWLESEEIDTMPHRLFVRSQ